jgi:hypothetical protein
MAKVSRRHSAGLMLVAVPVLAAGWPNTAGAQAAIGPRLQTLIDTLARQGRQDQGKLVVQALSASPQLMAQFNAAANSARLTALDVTNQRPGPFAATYFRGELLFAPDFMAQQRKQRLHDVTNPTDILPDNLVFALGTLIFYADAQPVPFGPNPQAFAKAATERDASAFINGWNAVVEAALKENRGKPLSDQQVSALILNLKYRAIFANATALGKYKVQPGGAIEPTQQNVTAIAAGLLKMNIQDIGAPPGP